MTSGQQENPDLVEIAAGDLVVDHKLAQLSHSFRFLLDITPVDADDAKGHFLDGDEAEPTFTYRELETPPEVIRAMLDDIDVSVVEDATLGQLLRAKHRELELQLDMLEARESDDFLQLSIELYGGVSPSLREQLRCMEEFDVVMLRNDPADDAENAPWRNNAGCAFGQLIAASGVLVVNDPTTLANALSKAYFQHFPEIVRPHTLISRDQETIEAFIKELGGKAVLKPLQGSGGAGVFLVDRKEAPNLTQIIEAISRDGYVVTQEYLPEAVNGDVRMFVMNGQPLMHSGEYAAFRRTNKTQDIRSNMSAGGQAEKVTVTDEMLEMVEIVRPKLVSDGMFLVGLDIVGSKLMEINVFSPGGLGSAQSLYDVNFAPAVIGELERKVNIRQHYPEIDNQSLATS